MATKRKKGGKVCEVCGHPGIVGQLLTCSRCEKTTEHIYCMSTQLFKVPSSWCCEQCKHLPDASMFATKSAVSSKQCDSTDCTFNHGTTEPSIKRRNLPSNNTMSNVQREDVCCSPKILPKFNRGTPQLAVASSNTSSKMCKAQETEFSPPEEVVSLSSHGKVCGICGASGRVDDLVTCYHCKRTTEHIYCMRIKLSVASSSWCCEECQRLPDTCMVETKSAVASKRNSVGKTSKPDSTDCSFYPGTSETPVKRSPLSNKITTNAQSDSVGGSAKTLNVLLVDNVDAFRSPEKCNTTCNDVKDPVSEGKESGTALNSDSEFKKNGDLKMKLPSRKQEEMNLPPLKKEGMNLPQFRKEKMNVPLVFVPTQQTCWMGRLNVFHLVSHEYTGIQARFPTWINVKVWEISKHLPEVLNLKVLQRSQVWPPIFQQDPPTESDIGLCLFPCQSGRPKEKYMRLVERLDSNDQAMSGVVNDIELLVFVSNKLPAESQRIDGQKYLWVVFRHLKQQKLEQQIKVQSHPSVCAQLESSTGKNCREVDNVKEQKTSGTNKSTPSCDPNIPPKFSIKGTDAITNIPPGFSRKLNPKCQKESHQTTMKGPRNHKEVDMVDEQDTERTERSVPSCDTVILPKFPNKGTDRTDVKNPPGFCEKLSSESKNSHQTIFKVLRSDKEVDMVKDQETGSDDKFIQNCDPGVSPKFSNKVTDATDPNIPPGFTEKMSSKYQYKSHQTIIEGSRSNKEVSMVKQEETTVAADSNIPPGFTEKQRNKSHETRDEQLTDNQGDLPDGLGEQQR